MTGLVVVGRNEMLQTVHDLRIHAPSTWPDISDGHFADNSDTNTHGHREAR